jgi:hypothetical protein
VSTSCSWGGVGRQAELSEPIAGRGERQTLQVVGEQGGHPDLVGCTMGRRLADQREIADLAGAQPGIAGVVQRDRDGQRIGIAQRIGVGSPRAARQDQPVRAHPPPVRRL